MPIIAFGSMKLSYKKNIDEARYEYYKFET